MHDTTAAALSYGIYKTDLPADKATNVVFLDMGASDTTVSVWSPASRATPTLTLTLTLSLSLSRTVTRSLSLSLTPNLTR